MAMAAEHLENEIAPDIEKELMRHPGKWVAMTREKILAVGDSVGEVRAKAIALGEAVPSIYKVPQSPGHHFF